MESKDRSDNAVLEKFENLRGVIGQLQPDQQQELAKIMAEGERDPVTAKTSFDAFMEKLPPAMQEQLRNGIIDVASLTPEQLRGLAMSGAADGQVDGLEFAMRGDTSNALNNWKAMTAGAGAQAVTPGTNLSAPQTPPVAQGEKKDKGAPTVGV